MPEPTAITTLAAPSRADEREIRPSQRLTAPSPPKGPTMTERMSAREEASHPDFWRCSVHGIMEPRKIKWDYPEGTDACPLCGHRMTPWSDPCHAESTEAELARLREAVKAEVEWLTERSARAARAAEEAGQPALCETHGGRQSAFRVAAQRLAALPTEGSE